MQLNFKQFKEQMPQNGQEIIVNNGAKKLSIVTFKNDLSKLIHLDETILFGTLFGRKKVFNSINFISGFAADADFYEKASKKFRVKKANLRTYIYHRNIPNSICATIKKQIQPILDPWLLIPLVFRKTAT